MSSERIVVDDPFPVGYVPTEADIAKAREWLAKTLEDRKKPKPEPGDAAYPDKIVDLETGKKEFPK